MRERLDAIKAERAQVRGELTGLAKDTDPLSGRRFSGGI